MKKIKKIPEEMQIALILKDLDESQLEQMKQLIIGMIVLLNKIPKEKTLPIIFQENQMMN